MHQTRFLIALFAFLATILLATTCVEGSKVPTRQTNAYRLRRRLAPLPPAVRRTPTPVAMARAAASSAASATQGRVQVRKTDGTAVGYLSKSDSPGDLNVANTGDVYVKFVSGSLLAQNAAYSPPYIGQTDAELSGTIEFANVQEGDLSEIWSLDTSTGALTAQWVNPDGSQPATYIVYFSDNEEVVFSSTETADGGESVSLYIV